MYICIASSGMLHLLYLHIIYSYICRLNIFFNNYFSFLLSFLIQKMSKTTNFRYGPFPIIPYGKRKWQGLKKRTVTCKLIQNNLFGLLSILLDYRAPKRRCTQMIWRYFPPPLSNLITVSDQKWRDWVKIGRKLRLFRESSDKVEGLRET